MSAELPIKKFFSRFCIDHFFFIYWYRPLFWYSFFHMLLAPLRQRWPLVHEYHCSDSDEDDSDAYQEIDYPEDDGDEEEDHDTRERPVCLMSYHDDTPPEVFLPIPVISPSVQQPSRPPRSITVDDACCICLEPLVGKTTNVYCSTRCGIQIHHECFARCHKNQCPMCRETPACFIRVR